MIVDPDFLDHWKTRMLVGLLESETAPIYVLRLWAHCQNRRQFRFENLSSEALKALCHFPGQANKLESSLVASGFVRRDANLFVVIGWDDYNSSLIAAWKNGKKGGRPRKPTGFQKDDSEKPTGSRIDRRGVDGNGKEKKGGEGARPTLDEVAAYCRERNNAVDPQKWFDHYSANGWRVGRSSMKDWQAAVRTWERNSFSDKPPKPPSPVIHESATRHMTQDEIDAKLGVRNGKTETAASTTAKAT